jgi:hypothetical protein
LGVVKAAPERSEHRSDVRVDLDTLLRQAEEELGRRVRDASFERRLGP